MTEATGRLGRFLQENPRSGSRIIYVLSIALILCLTAILAQAMDLGQYFEPPYPSESTPLTATEMGIEWTQQFDPYFEFTEGWNYTSIWVYWSRSVTTDEGGTASSIGVIQLYAGQDCLDNGYPASAEWHFGGGDDYELWVNVTDAVGDGSFGEGDKIAIKAVPEPAAYWQEGYTYVIGVAYVGEPYQVSLGVYNLAFHNGEFYSWENQELSASTPWWEQW